MDPSAVSSHSIEEDEWDTDGFVIPSVGVEDSDQTKSDSPVVESPSISVEAKKEEEHIYLGPHGAPPSLSKQQEQNQSTRKQKFKHRLKDADRKFSGTGRENKVDHLRELAGGKLPANPSKSSPREWLDPHCHESEFEKKRF